MHTQTQNQHWHHITAFAATVSSVNQSWTTLSHICKQQGCSTAIRCATADHTLLKNLPRKQQQPEEPLLHEFQNNLPQLCYRHKDCLVHLYLQEPFLPTALQSIQYITTLFLSCILISEISTTQLQSARQSYITLFKESQQDSTSYTCNLAIHLHFGIKDM